MICLCTRLEENLFACKFSILVLLRLLSNEDEDEESDNIYLYFIPHFCMQLRFYIFSTLVSLEDRLRLKLKVKTNISCYSAGPPMAIPIIHSTTVLCDILWWIYIVR